MKPLKFSELTKKAKKIAVATYIEGWYETHDKDDELSWDDAYSCCIDIDEEVLYNKDGTDFE